MTIDAFAIVSAFAIVTTFGRSSQNESGLSNENIGENPMPRKPKVSSARFVHGGERGVLFFVVILGRSRITVFVLALGQSN
jgi:hypothetical protein